MHFLDRCRSASRDALDSYEKRRLRLVLESEGRPGLYEQLVAAKGVVLEERFRLEDLIAVGRQSFLFRATDRATNESVVVKQAAFDYTNPIIYSRDDVANARGSLVKEHEVLRVSSGVMPRPIALLTSVPAVPAAHASPWLASDEVFLAEELIRGETLTTLTLRTWPRFQPHERETALRRIVGEFLTFWEKLHSAGWHYGDISADNLLVQSSDGRLRLVDGGSAVPAEEEVVLTGYSPAFMTPSLWDKVRHRYPVPGTLAAALPALAKIVHFALTRREPINGQFPDMQDPALKVHGELCYQALNAMLELDSHPEKLALAIESIAKWIG